MKYDVIIIGAGLGGLQCGYILSKRGMKVCVLEKNSQTGGCLQTFQRDGATLNTGFHYVGGLDKGQPLHRLFDYFGLLDLPWLRMDENGFDEVIINKHSYLLANGYERFVETLAEQFPHQRKNLQQYVAMLQKVSGNLDSVLDPGYRGDPQAAACFAQSAYDWLTSVIDDPLLLNVLSCASLKMELHQRTLPLYTFAQINASFIQSAWRLRGGSQQIADRLAASIEASGGTVRTNAGVTGLIERGGQIVSAEINGEERLDATHFIADIHPALALSLVRKSKLIKKADCNRLRLLDNTVGMCSSHIILNKDNLPYQNRNLFLYEVDGIWDYSRFKLERAYWAMISCLPPESGSQHTRVVEVMTPVRWHEVSEWEDTTVENRGTDYDNFKRRHLTRSLTLASAYFKGFGKIRLPDDVEGIHASTPLTWRDYTGAPHGSAYGIRKDCNNIASTLLSPRTPVPNLYLTGQNLNVHGVLGVSVTSFLTSNLIKD